MACPSPKLYPCLRAPTTSGFLGLSAGLGVSDSQIGSQFPHVESPTARIWDSGRKRRRTGFLPKASGASFLPRGSAVCITATTGLPNGGLSTSSNCILIYTCGAEPLGPIDNTTNNQEFRGRIVISIPPLGLKTRPRLARMNLWGGTASLMEPIGASSRKVVDAKSLKNMVGPCGLEPHTSTMSKTIDLLLLPKHLRVGFAVGVKVLMFTAFPSGFQFRLANVPVRAASL